MFYQIIFVFFVFLFLLVMIYNLSVMVYEFQIEVGIINSRQNFSPSIFFHSTELLFGIYLPIHIPVFLS